MIISYLGILQHYYYLPFALALAVDTLGCVWCCCLKASTASLIAWFGVDRFILKSFFVIGLAPCWVIHSVIAFLSYVWPSSAITGSLNNFNVNGQIKYCCVSVEDILHFFLLSKYSNATMKNVKIYFLSFTFYMLFVDFVLFAFVVIFRILSLY